MIKQLVFVALLVAVMSQFLCPTKLAIDCEQHIQMAYQQCEKAAKQKGADQTADLNCVKYLLSSEKDCWACICTAAKTLGWKIRGCELGVNLVQEILRRD